jgi:hypothetical protein
MQLIVVSGLSGSGKSIALAVLEDAGYYCVDNLPGTLLLEVADFLGESNFIDGVTVGAPTTGRWLVRAAGGLEFRGVGAVPLQAGQPVTAAVRPEKLVPVDDAAGASDSGARWEIIPAVSSPPSRTAARPSVHS